MVYDNSIAKRQAWRAAIVAALFAAPIAAIVWLVCVALFAASTIDGGGSNWWLVAISAVSVGIVVESAFIFYRRSISRSRRDRR